MRLSPNELLEHLRLASEDLLYPSETDAPFVPFAWQAMRDFSIDKLLIATRHDRNTPVEGTELEDFFAPLTRIHEWFDDSERATAERFQNLVETLRAYLSDIAVYRIGTVDIDIYIIGKTADGYFAGLSTKAVET
ncbi:MAG: nuclease A inhibitor family protein [Bacteroidota bacterium]|nr:nuclease A inhibitor family protein [Candidatus Kapabacteria bacterium]MDW8219489.1 nuclease A inhibitor family protein [Bacteroidota bacterium]